MINSMERDFSAYVLAGGQSTRMGTDKAFVIFEGRTLLSRMLEVARSLTPTVRIVGKAAKYAEFAPVIDDIFPGCGPLAGIHAALRATQTELNVILAVDVPFVSAPLVEYLVSRARNSVAVTLPNAAGGLQPLCAVYRREFADAAEAALRAGHYKIDAVFDQTTAQIIQEEELAAAGFSPGMFRNLNRPEDLSPAHE
jgi:molybdenum cofactor guanylyltransferase